MHVLDRQRKTEKMRSILNCTEFCVLHALYVQKTGTQAVSSKSPPVVNLKYLALQHFCHLSGYDSVGRSLHSRHIRGQRATYRSPKIPKWLVRCCRLVIQEFIHKVLFYSVITEKAVDISNQEEMPIIRYVHPTRFEIWEDFLLSS